MFDVLILGGGSDGCRLAARLSDDPALQVGLLEAGPAVARRPRPSWPWRTLRQPGLNGRSVPLPAGKGLGGTAAWRGASGAALPPRPNLHVFCDALAVRVLLRAGRAVGVEFHRQGLVQRLFARQAVVSCAGALGTPALLLRSGIGPHDELARHGVAPLLELPGLGQGLQVPLALRLPAPPQRPWLDRLLRRTASSALADAPPPPWPLALLPDAALLVLPAPRSRGHIGLAAKDPEQPPRIDPELLGMREDLEALRDAVAQTACWLAAQDRRPAPAWAAPARPLALEAWLREHTEAAPGACGSCSVEVLDADLRVRGVDGLYVADASALAPGHGDDVRALRAGVTAQAVRCLSRLAPPAGR